MRISFFTVPVIALMLAACGETEKATSDNHMPEITQKQWDQSEMNKKRDKCILQNRIDGTNIDCHKKYPKQPG